MQDINELIYILPEDKDVELFSGTEIRPKRENSGTRIDLLVISFDGRINKLGKIFSIK